MKVKHAAADWCEYNVVEESPSYYIVKSEGGPHIALDKKVYEPITEEKWVDVTAACGFSQGGLASRQAVDFQHHPDTVQANTLFEWPYLATLEGYRLRKVLVGDEARCIGFAFIVEKKDA